MRGSQGEEENGGVKKIIAAVNSHYNKIVFDNAVKKTTCSMCYCQISDPLHVLNCRTEQITSFVQRLRTLVQNLQYEPLYFLQYFEFAGLKIHPLDLTAIKILKRLFILFALTQEKSVLYDIFLVLNSYNTQIFRPLTLSLFDVQTNKILLKSLPVHVNILQALKTRVEQSDQNNSVISYNLALYEIAELYHVNMICL